jgi:hypothetical protein
MSNDNKFEGGQEVQAAWYKFETVGQGVKGTLLSKRLQKGQDAFPDQYVYELQTEDGMVNVGVSVNKAGTVQRLNSCKIGEIVGILFEKEVPATKKGFAPAKYLKVLSFGIDPNYNAMSGGEEVGGVSIDEIPM